MNKPQRILFLSTIIFLLAACSLPARPGSSSGSSQAQLATMVAMTLEAIQSQQPSVPQPASSPVGVNSPMPSLTPSLVTATATAAGTITPTYSVPMLGFDGNTNCREGPGTDYKVVTLLYSGQKVEAVGQQGNYWVVKLKDGSGTCWVANDFATPSGSTWTLPTMTAPPPPTAAPPAAPTWSKWNYTCAFASGGNTITMEMAWTDRATNETGYKVFRDGQAVATLGPDSSSYTDVTFLASGKTAKYYIEAYSDSGNSDTSTVEASCQ